ncbi:MAG: FHA domain-containing protein [Planctomycetes bacterium]|nr:FHA domain-containing protein [Planctomycetota bacterium]
MRADFRVLRGPGMGQVYTLPQIGRIVLGRGVTCQLRLDDFAVSSEHCAIESRADAHVLVDLGSRNGTLVNGERVSERTLGAGDVVRLGDTALEYAPEATGTGGGSPATRLRNEETPWGRSDASFCGRLRVHDPAFWEALGEHPDTGGWREIIVGLREFVRLGATAAEARELSDLGREALDAALEATGASHAALIVLPRLPELATIELVRARPGTAAPAALAISRSVTAECLRTGESILTTVRPPASAVGGGGGAGAGRVGSGGLPRSDSMDRLGIRALICVPVECEGRVQGVLYVDSLNEATHFGRGTVALLALFAEALGSAIGRRILAERERQAEVRLAHLLEYAQVGLFSTDAEGRIRHWSRGCERITGRPAEEVLGREGLEFLLGAEAGEAAAWGAARRPYEAERLLATAQGGSYLGHIQLTPYRGAEDRFAGLVGTLEDVTGQRASQEKRAQHERMATLGLLVAGVAHDFRNVLARLLLLAHDPGLVALSPADPAAGPRGILNRAVSQGSALCESLLAYARRHPDKTEEADLGELVADTLRLVASELASRRILVTRQIGSTGPIQVNAGLMQSVFLNLLLNAKEAMPQGGRITVSVLREGEEARIGFSDTGIGMSPEVLGRLFQPFFSNKTGGGEGGSGGGGGGTGLGLYMSREIVARHGGTLECASTPGVGTTFTLRLPLRRSEPPAAEGGAAAAGPDAHPGA